jgi:SWI/SNF-related matrix-associated actin-dependent regulator 1 of chromatin subfamily A
MKKIIFRKLKTNIKISFYSSTYDSGLVSACQKLKPNIKFDYSGDKSWYILIPEKTNNNYLEDISLYSEILSFFEKSEQDKLIQFFNKKNKKLYENKLKNEKLKQEEIVKFENNINRYPTLYRHQKDGVKFLLEKSFESSGIIVADEMGLGKTKMSIVFCEIRNFKKIIVVCPASLKYNWEREIVTVNNYASVCILPQHVPDENTKYFIINYDILIKEFDFEKLLKKDTFKITVKEDSFLAKYKFDAMLLDEAHYLKNQTSKRSKVIVELSNMIDITIPISGTPLKNKTKDIFNLLKIIKHPLGNSFFNFGRRYCNGYENGFGWNFDGSSNTTELYEKLNSVILRRLKKDCLDLPEKIINEVFIDLSANMKKVYYNAFQEYLTFVRDVKLVNKNTVEVNIAINSIIQAEELVKITLLKQICSISKADMLKEKIDDMLEEDPERKIVIFSQFNEIINLLYAHYEKISVKLTGATSQTNRQKAVDNFQNDEKVRLFIGNLQAGGVGITLARSDTVIFTDLAWTPSEHEQAMDRLHRIGQKNNVNVFFFITKDTIEEDIYRLLKAKSKNINKIIDGIDIIEKEQISVFSEFTNNIKTNFF